MNLLFIVARVRQKDFHAIGLKVMERRTGLIQSASQLADVHLELGEGLLALARHSHLQILELILHALQLPDLLVLPLLEHHKARHHGQEQKAADHTDNNYDVLHLQRVRRLRLKSQHTDCAAIRATDLHVHHKGAPLAAHQLTRVPRNLVASRRIHVVDSRSVGCRVAGDVLDVENTGDHVHGDGLDVAAALRADPHGVVALGGAQQQVLALDENHARLVGEHYGVLECGVGVHAEMVRFRLLLLLPRLVLVELDVDSELGRSVGVLGYGWQSAVNIR